MLSPRPRPGILEIVPYVGGKSGDGSAGKPVAKLSSNESPLGPSPKAAAAYRELAGELHRYPDGNCTDLRQAIGRRHNLDPEAIVCGAGSDELIGLLVRAYAGPGDEVLYSRHGFLMYPLAALAAGAHPVAAPETRAQGGCRRAAGARHLAHPAGVLGQPEQPDRQLPAARTELARLRGRPAAPTWCW